MSLDLPNVSLAVVMEEAASGKPKFETDTDVETVVK
jgi:hypothetical protein